MCFKTNLMLSTAKCDIKQSIVQSITTVHEQHLTHTRISKLTRSVIFIQ